MALCVCLCVCVCEYVRVCTPACVPVCVCVHGQVLKKYFKIFRGLNFMCVCPCLPVSISNAHAMQDAFDNWYSLVRHVYLCMCPSEQHFNVISNTETILMAGLSVYFILR